MTITQGGPLLTEAPVGRHFAQLHATSGALGEAVLTFVEAGLRRDQCVVVIAARPHVDLLIARLEQARLHPAALRASGQLMVLDPGALLPKFMRDGMPHWSEFRTALGQVLEHARTVGSATRVYTELTSILWEEGSPAAAIRLEEFWNALGRLFSFAQYCGYLLDPHAEDSYTGPIEEIGRTHTDILGTVEDERFGAALDEASREVFGIALSQMIGYASTLHEGERRFPSGLRTMLWVRRYLPSSSQTVLERAHQYFRKGAP